MTILFNIFLVVFFVLLNAFFVVAEFSMVKVRRSQISMLAADGRPAARYAKLVTDDLNAYLSACQLGITLASLALGWLGEPAVSKMIGPLLYALGFSEAAVHGISVAFGFAIITTLHIVLGELVPKSLAILSTERYVLMSAMPLYYFYRLTYPIMWLFNTITSQLLRLAGHSMAEENNAYSDEELQLLLAESHRSGLLDHDKYEYVDNIFELSEKDAESIMTPRVDMVCLYVEDPLSAHLATASESKFTRYPVCTGDKDHLLGFVHIKDLYALSADRSLHTIVRDILMVHESTAVPKLLQLFKADNTKIAAVIDEHGGVSGIVTLSDAISEIVGDIEDEYAHGEEDIWRALGDDRYEASGSAPLELLVQQLGLTLPEETESETIGGFLLELSGELPEEGQQLTYGALSFTIKTLADAKIVSVTITSKPAEPAAHL